MKNQTVVAFLLTLIGISPVSAETARQTLAGHVPAAVKLLNLQPMDSLSATQKLSLAVGLPLRNREGLTNLLQQIYDPASPNYRHYLKPAEFVEQFGPTEADYEAVVAFAKTNGWMVIGRDPGRMIVDVSAAVSDVERVCHVKMRVFQHPTEARTFYAPDKEPSLDLVVPVSDIAGLENYFRPRPAGLGMGHQPRVSPGAGSAPGGNLMGNDFRAAYAPGISLNGSGQTLGLLELDGYYTNDIRAYEAETGLPNVTLTNELVDSFDGTPSSDDGEISLDIEMAIAMAPGLSKIIVYETQSSPVNDLLKQMANDGTATEISSSWFWGGVDSTTTAYFQRLAMQGQSFFEASGDGLAYSGGITLLPHAGPPAGNPYVTSVGGTTLTTSATRGWVSETTWNNEISGKGTNGSSGGFSETYATPDYQTNTSMSANGGSATMRNIPDVAMVAEDVWVIANNGKTNWFWGTSCAAPLWAGFCALVNQQAAKYGNPPVGFINAAVYSLGNSPEYSAVFHDITTGNNTNAVSPNLFFACPGYDLCTGWGTPTGINLINALALTDPLMISPGAALPVGGAAGGPFYPATQTFHLTNNGSAALSWSATEPSALLSVSPASGLLPAHGKTNVTVTLHTSVNSLAMGFYSPNLMFSNLTLHAEQTRPFTVQVGLPPLTFDDLNYDPNWNPLPAGYGGISWSNFYYVAASVHGTSGYEAGMVSSPNVIFNGNAGTAWIKGPAPFDLLSATLTGAWDDNLNVEARGYNGSTLAYDVTNTLSATVPTVVHYNFFGVTSVEFLPSGGTQHSGYSGSGRYFVMDNVVAVPHSVPSIAPVLQSSNHTAGVIALDWNTTMGQTYQLQYSTNLSRMNWINLGSPLTATNYILTGSDTSTNRQKFYRLFLLP